LIDITACFYIETCYFWWRFSSSKMEEKLVRFIHGWYAEVLWQSWQSCGWRSSSHSN